MIHHRAVRDKGQGSRKVRVVVLSRILSEKLFGKGLGKELHGHGVYFTGFHARPNGLSRHSVPVDIGRKGMPRFVGNHFDIMLCAVKVGKDKRRLIIHNRSTVTASLLSLRGKKVHQFILNHMIKEFGGFRGKPVIELLSGFHNLIRISRGLRISGTELDGRIGIA